jgi:hypothetical protein
LSYSQNLEGITSLSITGLKIKPLYTIFFFWWDGDLNLAFALAKEAPYHLSHTSSSFYSGYFGDRGGEGLMNFLPRLA